MDLIISQTARISVPPPLALFPSDPLVSMTMTGIQVPVDSQLLPPSMPFCDGVPASPCGCCDPATCTIYNGSPFISTETPAFQCQLCDLNVKASSGFKTNTNTELSILTKQTELTDEPFKAPVSLNLEEIPRLEPSVTEESTYKGPFSDPVFKKLSRINGEINKMSYIQLKERLSQLGLDNRGFKDVLKKRLKSFYKKQSLIKAKVTKPQEKVENELDYLIVIDFEATCEEKNHPEYPHEVIEFPAVVVDVKTKEIVDTFHSFVRPIQNPKLSKFCKTLTGISQETVEQAPAFFDVMASFEQWLSEKKYFTKFRSEIVTDGPWDMCRFMVSQCKISKLKVPTFARKWCNIRKVFGNFYGTKRLRLIEMLYHLGLTFEGKPHSGLDDARNIAIVAIRLIKDGASFSANEKLQKYIVAKLTQKSANNSLTEEDFEDECESDTDEDEQKENLAWAMKMLEIRDQK